MILCGAESVTMEAVLVGTTVVWGWRSLSWGQTSTLDYPHCTYISALVVPPPEAVLLSSVLVWPVIYPIRGFFRTSLLLFSVSRSSYLLFYS